MGFVCHVSVHTTIYFAQQVRLICGFAFSFIPKTTGVFEVMVPTGTLSESKVIVLARMLPDSLKWPLQREFVLTESLK